MLLDTGTLIGIMIALAGSCFVMVVSIQAHRKIMRVNLELEKQITHLNNLLMIAKAN